LALLRHRKIADRFPLSGEERSCSGHHGMTEFDPERSFDGRCMHAWRTADVNTANPSIRRLSHPGAHQPPWRDY
jgi:hypothetical protein